MVEIYYKLVVNGRRTLDQVPESLRSAVEATLIKNGYDVGGHE